MEIFLVSALAKLGATITTYPLLLIKQRLQSAGRHTHKDRQYSGTADAVQRIWKTEGEIKPLSLCKQAIAWNGMLR